MNGTRFALLIGGDLAPKVISVRANSEPAIIATLEVKHGQT
jgi:hypothetical protein